MNKFTYNWDSDKVFLLHVQLDNDTDSNYQAKLSREYAEGISKEEFLEIKKRVKSYRFIISKSLPTEKAFSIKYPKDIKLEVFKVDDRAYYPTESFFIG